jgi:hypothetical protein
MCSGDFVEKRMTRFFLAAITITICCTQGAFAEQQGKQQTLQQRLQGTWSRPNDDRVWVIKGKDCTEYLKKNPLTAHAKGTLGFPMGKDYADAKLNNGWTIWFFAVGKDSMVTEDFRPSGDLQGVGCLLYRQPESE